MAKFFGKVIAALLVLAILCGAAYGIGYAITGEVNPLEWIKPETVEPEDENSNGFEETGGLVVTPEHGENGAAMVSVRRIPRVAYASNGIVPYAESATKVSVVNPMDFLTYHWALSWATEKSEAVEESVTLSSTTGTSVNVTALEAFDTQIILTCSAFLSEDLESGSATCTVDYEQRLEGVTFNGVEVKGQETIDVADLLGEGKTIIDLFTDDLAFTVEGKFGVGSLAGSMCEFSVSCVDGTGLGYMDETVDNVESLLGLLERTITDAHDSTFYEELVEDVKAGDKVTIGLIASYFLNGEIAVSIKYNSVAGTGEVDFFLCFSERLFAGVLGDPELDRDGVVM